MNINKRLAVIGAVPLTVFAFVPLAANASSLTTSQISAIESLLSSFGASASVIANVNAALTGTPPVVTDNSGPTTSSGAASTGGSSATGTSSFKCPNLSANLSIGATGSQVSQLQQYLGVSPTGYFGSQTQAAVQAWQSSNGVTSTGTVGPLTRAAFINRCGMNPGPGIYQPEPTMPSTGTNGNSTQASATISQTSVTPTADPIMPSYSEFNLSGTVTGATAVTVVGVSQNYSGPTDQDSVLAVHKFFGATGYSGVVGGNWSSQITDIATDVLPATYTAFVYAYPSNALIGQATITVNPVASSQPSQGSSSSQISSFTATPGTVNAGENSELSWNTASGWKDCYVFSSESPSNQSISPAYSGLGLPLTFFDVTPSVTTTYTLSCSQSWADGSPTATSMLTVNVLQ